jgi:hypothetical protein
MKAPRFNKCGGHGARDLARLMSSANDRIFSASDDCEAMLVEQGHNLVDDASAMQIKRAINKLNEAALILSAVFESENATREQSSNLKGERA